MLHKLTIKDAVPSADAANARFKDVRITARPPDSAMPGDVLRKWDLCESAVQALVSGEAYFPECQSAQSVQNLVSKMTGPNGFMFAVGLDEHGQKRNR
jgi:hypothetical protein